MEIEKLEAVLQELVRSPDINGNLQCCIIIPDYTELLKKEIERQDVIITYEIFDEEKISLELIANKVYKHPDDFHKKLNTIDYEIDGLLTKPVLPSHTVFAAFDSLDTIMKLKEKLRYEMM